MKKDALVRIVFDPGKNKLRAKPVDCDGFIRFPNHLRIKDAIYMVDLKPGKAGSWVATGPIKSIVAGAQAVSYRKAA
jgi:hypothetical protein